MMAARAVSRLGRVVKAARAPALAAAVDSTPATAVATSAFRELLAVREVTRRALHTSSCRRQDAGTYDVTSDSDAAASATTGAGTDDDEFTLAQRSEMWLLRQLALDQGGDDFPENPYTSRAVYSTDVVTEEENPAAHSAENVGQYYSLPADLSELFPDGLPGRLEGTEFTTTGKRQLMIREAGVKLIEAMKRYAEQHAEFKEGTGDKPERLPSLQLLRGIRGVGKSAILAHVLHYARANGWVTLSIPNSHDVMHKGYVLTKSRTRKGMVDQHDIAMQLLKTTLDIHGEQLEEVPQRQEYPRDRYLPADVDEVIMSETRRMRAEHQDKLRKARALAAAENRDFDESSVERESLDVLDAHVDRSKYTLRDMVEWGLRHPPLATDALLALKAELQVMTEFPVLMAVDGINHFYDHSPYPVDGKTVSPERLSIPHAFQVVGRNGFDHRQRVQSGMIVATTSLFHDHNMNTFNSKTKVKAKMCVEVPRLERQELFSQLTHYAKCGRFFLVHDEEDVDGNEVEYYNTLTDSVPERVYDCAMYH